MSLEKKALRRQTIFWTSCEVILTEAFRREAKKHRSLGADLKVLIAELEENPYLGDRLKPNAYKVRLAIKSKGRGKSGGGRIITYVNVSVEKRVADQNVNVYLLMIYDKGDVENIRSSEVDARIKGIAELEEE